MNDKPCLCYFPCKKESNNGGNENCPKEKDDMCWVNHCEVVKKYSSLTYGKNYCSICGRKLK
jgi:hypothetical protein